MKTLGVSLLVFTTTLASTNTTSPFCSEDTVGLTPIEAWMALTLLSLIIVVQFGYILRLKCCYNTEQRSDEMELIKHPKQAMDTTVEDAVDGEYEESKREHIYESVIYQEVTSLPGVRYTQAPNSGYERIKYVDHSSGPSPPGPNISRVNKSNGSIYIDMNSGHASPDYETLSLLKKKSSDREVNTSHGAGIVEKVQIEIDPNGGYEVPRLHRATGDASSAKKRPFRRVSRLESRTPKSAEKVYLNLDRPIAITKAKVVKRKRAEHIKGANSSMPRLDNEQLLSVPKRSTSTSLLHNTGELSTSNVVLFDSDRLQHKRSHKCGRLLSTENFGSWESIDSVASIKMPSRRKLSHGFREDTRLVTTEESFHV